MKIEVLTIFPDMFRSFLETSLIEKAISRGALEVYLTDIRSFATPPHMKVDDEPYGGGAGMVLKPEPLYDAIQEAKKRLPDAPVVYLSPGGTPFTQTTAEQCSKKSGLILVCGRYEGVDQRVLELLVDAEWSIGDYVLMGGEVPAMVVIEAVTRLCDNVLGNQESTVCESFAKDARGAQFLEAPQYTRPPVFKDLAVPDALLSGNHKLIDTWRHEQALEKTKRVRPDLLEKFDDN